MATKTDTLLAAFDRALHEPWPAQLWVELQMGDFEAATRWANRRWVPISVKLCFPECMAAHDYREGYGEYQRGIYRIIDTYLKHLDQPK